MYKVWSANLQSKLVILQGTLVGHLRLVMLKDLQILTAARHEQRRTQVSISRGGVAQKKYFFIVKHFITIYF